MYQPASRELEVAPKEPDFSVVLGGPLYQFYLRTRLARPPIDLVGRRVIALCLICWVPPFLLSLFSSTAFGRVHVPFLLDIGANVRFLCAVPLLITAECVVQRRIPRIVRLFFDRRIISNSEKARFEALVSSITRVRDSPFIEISLALLAFGAFWMWRKYPTLGGNTWYGTETNGKLHFTVAGYWYFLISLPLLRFLLLRWYFRLTLWYWLLWGIRRFSLHLNLLHPDLAGGLGFLSGSATAFVPVLLAQTTIAAGVVADEVRYAGMRLLDFKIDFAAILIFLLFLVFVPLCFFMTQLILSRRKAKNEYGTLASQYVDAFWNKWIRNHPSGETQMLGTSDIQSLADLANAYNVVNRMRIVPFGKATVIRVAILVCLPLLPLSLTLIPTDQMIHRFLKLVM
jgi:hypothetical protein